MANRRTITQGMSLARDSAGIAPSLPARDDIAYRSLTFDRNSVNEANRTVEFSFSSDIELERWPGTIEVLDHSQDAVDLSRLQNGAQLLFNHDRDNYIGVVERAWIGSDRKGRVIVRFSEHDEAEKIWRDVKAGILRNVSVGYLILEVKLTEERENGTDVYRVTRWQPYEVSIVTIPADTSVGVGRAARSFFTKPKPSKPKNVMTRDQMIQALRAAGHTVADDISEADLTALFQRSLAGPPATAPAAPQAPITTGTEQRDGQSERDRVRAILAAGRQYTAQDLAQEALEKGHTVEQFRTALIEHVDKRNKAVVDGTKPIGMTDKESRDFSFIRLFRVLCATEPSDKERHAKAAGLELAACRAAADQMTHRNARGTVIPIDVLLQPMVGQRADTIIGSKTGAGYTNVSNAAITTTLMQSSFIDMLRNRSVLMQLISEMNGLVGNLDIPKHLTGSTAEWIGEDEAAGKSDLTFGIISLRPKTLSNRGELTRKMLLQDSLGVEALLRQDLARSLALEIDRAGFYGSNANNQPKGLNQYTINSGTWAVANQPSFAKLVEMETAISADNADVQNMSYVANSAFRGHAKTTLKFTGVSGTIWEPGNTVNGYRTEISNQIQAGHVFFGNWADLIVGMWGGLDVLVDPYTHSDKGRVRITQFQDLDYAVRREESFALFTNPA